MRECPLYVLSCAIRTKYECNVLCDTRMISPIYTFNRFADQCIVRESSFTGAFDFFVNTSSSTDRRTAFTSNYFRSFRNPISHSINMSLDDVENIKKRIENFKKTLIELTETNEIIDSPAEHVVREMSAEVIDSNPYR